ncbi:MAG: hypothetical protein WCT52_01930 [Candidatus Micrarchaeia archaeon]
MHNKKIPRQVDSGIPASQPCASKSRFFKKFLAGTGIASLSMLAGCEGQGILPFAGVAVAAVFAFTPVVAAGSYFYFEAKWKKADATSPENYSKIIEQSKTRDFKTPPPLYFNSEVYGRLDITHYPNGHLGSDLLTRITPVPIEFQEDGKGIALPAYELHTYVSENGVSGGEMAACMQFTLTKLAQIREKAKETGDGETQKIVDDCFEQLDKLTRETKNLGLQATLSNLFEQLGSRGIEIGNLNPEEAVGLRWSTGGDVEIGAKTPRRTGSFYGIMPTQEERLPLTDSKE